jgi:hypothetical protein
MGAGTPGGRDGYADASLRPAGGDWQKYRYTYRVFGRLLYDPDADPEGWRRWLRHAFGAAAGDAEAALANASRVLLLVTTAYHPSASNNRYWPELYTNMPIADEALPHPYGDTPDPQRFGTVSPLDPELFCGVEEFADEVVRGERSGRYSPLDVARWLAGFAGAAAGHLQAAAARVGDRDGPEFRRWAADVAIQGALGRFFAHKLRAGVGYALYRRTGEAAQLSGGLAAYRRARDAWTAAAAHGRVYRDDLTFGPQPWLRGHWADRLAAIDQDVAAMARELEGTRRGPGRAGGPRPGGPGPVPAHLESGPPPAACTHVPPAPFRPGEPVPLELVAEGSAGAAQPLEVELRYRHVNQAETYRTVRMEPAGGGRYRAAVPGGYADSPYPLQYLFRLRDGRGRAWLYPGFVPDLSNQPYFLVRQAGAGEPRGPGVALS